MEVTATCTARQFSEQSTLTGVEARFPVRHRHHRVGAVLVDVRITGELVGNVDKGLGACLQHVLVVVRSNPGLLTHEPWENGLEQCTCYTRFETPRARQALGPLTAASCHNRRRELTSPRKGMQRAGTTCRHAPACCCVHSGFAALAHLDIDLQHRGAHASREATGGAAANVATIRVPGEAGGLGQD